MSATTEPPSPGGTPPSPNPNGHAHPPHPRSFWLWVMCLTGVDYFSTLAYQPSIAFENAGRLAPLATLVLVMMTLFGAYPVYAYVARQSPHGLGSIGMLEKLLSGWTAKIAVLVLLGFAATDFVITKTLSAADASAHLIANPNWPGAIRPADSPHPSDDPQEAERTRDALKHAQDRQRLAVTMFMLVFLGAVFLRGFREVIGLAVILVAVYMTLNALVIVSGLLYLIAHPHLFTQWWGHVETGAWELEHVPLPGTGMLTIILTALILFPKLALGLSGFETGVAVMPLIKGNPDDTDARPRGRIDNTRKLLLTAACIMSCYLLGSSLVVSTLIEPEALRRPAGLAVDRALAYLAHGEGPLRLNPLFGPVFGTIYDLATVSILWFAGASAMAALLNLVPQYLPRYGMAPEWSRAVGPMVIMFTCINLLVTWLFNADVEAQGGAYATGVLVLMSSACIATVIEKWRQSRRPGWRSVPWRFLGIAGVFIYTTIAIIVEKPEGIKIATAFIGTIVVTSLISRVRRATELRFAGFRFADPQSRFLWDSVKGLELSVLVPHRPGRRKLADKEAAIRAEHRLGDIPILFLEVDLQDASEFNQSPCLQVRTEDGRSLLKITQAASIAHTISAVALELAKVGKPPEIHFGWTDESPVAGTLGFLLFGEGNIPWMVHELIKKAEPDPERRPKVIIGGV